MVIWNIRRRTPKTEKRSFRLRVSFVNLKEELCQCRQLFATLNRLQFVNKPQSLSLEVSRFSAIRTVIVCALCDDVVHLGPLDGHSLLKIEGQPGTGKTRLLEVMKAVCYRGMDAGASPTRASLFRTIDTFRGTLIIDEADCQDDLRSSVHLSCSTWGTDETGA